MANFNTKTFGHVSVGLIKSLNVTREKILIHNNNFRFIFYSAFNWDPPLYAHLPLILNSQGSKLSKRHADANVDYYK